MTLDSGTATANQTLSVVAKTPVARKVNQQRRQHQLMSLHQQLITSQATLVRVMKLQEQQTHTTIEVRDPSGAVIGTGTSDANGDFTVTLPTGTTNRDTLTVIGKDNAGNESQPTEVLVPADATVTATNVTGDIIQLLVIR